MQPTALTLAGGADEYLVIYVMWPYVKTDSNYVDLVMAFEVPCLIGCLNLLDACQPV